MVAKIILHFYLPLAFMSFNGINTSVGVSPSWVQTWAVPLSNFVTLSKELNFSVLQFPHL